VLFRSVESLPCCPYAGRNNQLIGRSLLLCISPVVSGTMMENKPSLLDKSDRDGCIVVVAKCPLPGISKTRLAPLLGNAGAAALAKAMLSDVLVSLSQLKVPKILLYAPGTVEGCAHMTAILQELRLFKGWKLIPMEDGDATTGTLTSSDLGSKLAHALLEARAFSGTGGVVFLGMDSPQVPLDEIEHALYQAAHHNAALLCPAHDGGYGMLCVPRCASPNVFQGVKWSHPLTAVSQLKALTDAGVRVVLGRLMYDVDEASDVFLLANRLVHPTQLPSPTDRLQQSSSGKAERTGECDYTWDALVALGVIVADNEGQHYTININLSR